MLQLGHQEDEEKPQFAPLPSGAKLETVTLEQAMHAFKLPRVVGQTDRWPGYQSQHRPVRSIYPDREAIRQHQARRPARHYPRKSTRALRSKAKAEAEKNIADFGDGIKVLNGRFGPYITDGKKNAKIPKGH